MAFDLSVRLQVRRIQDKHKVPRKRLFFTAILAEVEVAKFGVTSEVSKWLLLVANFPMKHGAATGYYEPIQNCSWFQIRFLLHRCGHVSNFGSSTQWFMQSFPYSTSPLWGFSPFETNTQYTILADTPLKSMKSRSP